MLFEESKIEIQEQLLDLSTTVRQKTAEIESLRANRKGLIDELEKQATTAEGSSSPGLKSTGGLRRLERRWGENTETPN